MKDKIKLKLLELLEISLVIFFIFAVLVLVKYSSMPFIKLPNSIKPEILSNIIYKVVKYIKVIFTRPENSDGIFFNIALGYFVSYVFYILVVKFPEYYKKIKLLPTAKQNVIALYYEVISILFIIYKSENNQIDEIQIKNDIDFLNDDFLDKIKKFDAKRDASSLLLHKDSRNKISWLDKIELTLKTADEEINNIIRVFDNVLDIELIEALYEFKNNTFTSTFLGGVKAPYMIATDAEGRLIYERVPLKLFYESDDSQPIFDDSKMLRDYIDKLKKISNIIGKWDTFRHNHAIENILFIEKKIKEVEGNN